MINTVQHLQLLTHNVWLSEHDDSTHRLNIEKQNFFIEGRDAGQVGIESPVSGEVGNDYSPNRSRRHNLQPRHVTHLQSFIRSTTLIQS